MSDTNEDKPRRPTTPQEDRQAGVSTTYEDGVEENDDSGPLDDAGNPLDDKAGQRR